MAAKKPFFPLMIYIKDSSSQTFSKLLLTHAMITDSDCFFQEQFLNSHDWLNTGLVILE